MLSKLKSLSTVSLTEFFFLLVPLSYKDVAKNKPVIEVAIAAYASSLKKLP
ncbi:MAG: hypothetical protein V7L21_35510 [Nostoc sp.]|uniref:hypothetical protein n=1 Tax=Nostoc sp. TaxID=1180 RepID=UPI002FF8CFA6|nr:hypothetical protein [Nostoc sp. NMS9]